MCFRIVGRWSCGGLNDSNVLSCFEKSAELRDKVVHLHSTGHCPGLKNESPDAEIDISTFCNYCHHDIFLKAHV